MTKPILGFVIGLIFGFGLIISGMSNPAKVLNFLDVTGTFDPSLLFVMGGAVIVVFLGYKIILKRSAPILGEVFHIPNRNDIDGKLLIGAAMFGIGWGLSGFCPGPALTAVLLGSEGIIYFLPAMLVGMIFAKLVIK